MRCDVCREAAMMRSWKKYMGDFAILGSGTTTQPPDYLNRLSAYQAEVDAAVVRRGKSRCIVFHSPPHPEYGSEEVRVCQECLRAALAEVQRG